MRDTDDWANNADRGHNIAGSSPPALNRTERRLDRVEARLDSLAVEVRAIEVSTVTRLNSIDAKLAFMSNVLDGVNALSLAIQGPSNAPDQGLLARLKLVEGWRDELRGAQKLLLTVAALSPLMVGGLAVLRLYLTGHI